ncbi:NAD-dependent epimerase/dehydratase family protein [Psychromonas sp. PT13]|uniref:NAD-dependent epimerase/dehydratase family protein n=1 Tax=Psychromonas sp. PT13 TaxID=3439547 RepID=UPI003EBB80F9
MNKTAVVIGATGLVGHAIVMQIIQMEQISKIVTLTRRPVSYSSEKVVNQVVDFDNLEGISELLRGDYLFSCLGTTLKQAGSIEAQRKVDIDYQFKVAQLAANVGVEHYLLVSASGANPQSKNAYLKMKGELEQKITALPFSQISIFQPSLLLGQRDHFRMGEKIGSWILPILGFIPVLKRYRPITGQQVAKKMIAVSQQTLPRLNYFRLDDIFIK